MDPRRAVYLGLFFVSGVCGLGYQVVWLRLVAGLVGVGIFANAVVLATFMFGLGLGALAAPRWLVVDDPRRTLRRFAWLELALGGWALLVPTLVGALDSAFLGAGQGSLSRAAGSMFAGAVLLLPATTMIGASLPLLARLGSNDHAGRWIGLLYASETLGAMVGSVAAGWWLVPALGLRGTTLSLVSLNLALAGFAFLASPTAAGGGDVRVSTPASSTTRGARSFALLVAASTGAMGLALELTWMRGLAAYARDTVATQVITLATVLFGLALGASLGSRLSSTGVRSFVPLVVLQAIGVVGSVGGPIAVRAMVDGPGVLVLDSGLGVVVVAVALLPTTIASGASLPLAAGLVAPEWGSASAAGRVFAANTTGSVLGVLATGLWWIPVYGTRGSTAILTVVGALVVSLGLGLSLRTTPRDRRLVGLTVGAGGAVIAALTILARLPHAPHMPAAPPGGGEFVFAREDAVGLVEVVEDRGAKRLIIDRTYTWGSDDAMMLRTMRRQGYLPLLLHPAPVRVLELGLGTGVQFAPNLHHPDFEHGIIVEISPALAAAARHFDHVNDGVLLDPRVELVVGDGRDYVRSAPPGSFDVIVFGLFTAHRPGVSNLYSEDLYRVAMDRLGPGGLLVQWLPLDQLGDDSLRAIIRSFLAAAPEVHAFEKDHYLALVGTHAPLVIEWSAVSGFVEHPRVRADLASHGLLDPHGMLGSHLADTDALRALAGVGPHNTDDRPFVEFHPPPAALRGSYEQASRSLEALLDHYVPATTLVPGLSVADRERLELAGLGRVEFLRGAIAQVRGDRVSAAKHFEASARLNPNDAMARLAARR